MREPGSATGVRSCRSAGMAVGVTVGVLVVSGLLHRSLAAHIEGALGRSVPLRAPLSTLPLRLGAWEGRDVPVDERARRIAAEDDFLNREYRDRATGRTVGLYVGYIGRPRSALWHRPEICYPVHGLEQVSRQRFLVTTEAGESVPSLLYEFRSTTFDGPRVRVMATFIINGRVVEDLTGANQFNVRRVNLLTRRTAYVARVQCALEASGDAEEDLRLLSDFGKTIIGPTLEIMPKEGVESAAGGVEGQERLASRMASCVGSEVDLRQVFRNPG